MTPEVLAALRRMVDELGADAGVLVRLGPSGTAVVTSSTMLPAVRVGDEWGPSAALHPTDEGPELADTQDRLAVLVPAVARQALSAPVAAVLVVPLGDTLSRAILLWAQSPVPPDLLGMLESGSLLRFTLLAPLLDAQVLAEEAASQLRAVVEALDQGVVLTTLGGRRANVNGAAARLLGLAHGRVDAAELSTALRALWSRATEPPGLPAEAEALAASPTAVVRGWVWSLPGEPSHLRVSTAPVETATGRGRVWVFDDVSAEMGLVEQERQGRQALADSERRYRMLAENVSDVVVQGTTTGGIVWASPSVAPTLGWTPDDLAGTSFFDLVHPADLPRVREAQRILDGGEPVAFEVRLRTAGGGHRWMNVRVKPVLDGDGEIVGRVAGWWDNQASHEAVDRLAQSEERYRLLAENVSDVVVQGTAEGRITWVSPSVTSALGWATDDLVGRTFRDLVHPDELPVALAGNEQILRGGPSEYEARMRTAGGGYRWMNIRAKPLLDAEGNVVGRVAGWWDTQASHEARQQLEEAENRYRLLLQNTTEVVFQTVDGVLTWVSPALEEVTGWAAKAVLGGDTREIWHPDDWDRAVVMHDGVDSGTGRREVLRLRTPDGRTLWMEVVLRPYVGPDGRPGTVGMMYDVTERVLAQEAARQSEERYRTVAENASDVVCRYRADGVIEWISGSTETFVGRSGEEMVGTYLIDYFMVEDWGDRADIRARLGRGEAVQLLARLRHVDGGTRWVEVRAQAVVGANGALESIIGTMRDAQAEVEYRQALAASERQARRLVDAYEAARDEAIRSSTAKTAFLSRMSHELRTPLNAVLGFAQLLSLGSLTPEQDEAVQHIRAGGRHLLDLINEIVDISRIEAGRLSLSMQTVDAASVLADSVELVRPLAQQHGVVVVAAAPATTPLDVHADQQRVVQVLLNLMSNAVKYNRPGGSVRVGCRPGNEGEVVFEVSDTGPGIPTELLPRLFEPFDRLGAENTDVEGTGIGLALAEALARAMGGRIDVTTQVGTGSTFELVLRAAEAGPVEPPPADDEADPSRDSRLHILYVEDNPTNATLMARVVALRPGSRLQLAADGAQGIAAARHDPPDLVFLDLHLPDLTGEEVLRRLRRLPGCAQVPVVVVTADASPGARERMVELGSDGFLTKPLDLDEVLGWIDATASRAGAT